MTRAVKGVIALIVVGGIAMVAGGVWSYADEHSGEAAQAKVTDCYKRGGPSRRVIFCKGTWTVNERKMTGFISNGRLSDEGKTLSVRVHGERATKPTLWISIAAVVMGLFLLATAVLVVVDYRRKRPHAA